MTIKLDKLTTEILSSFGPGERLEIELPSYRAACNGRELCYKHGAMIGATYQTSIPSRGRRLIVQRVS